MAQSRRQPVSRALCRVRGVVLTAEHPVWMQHTWLYPRDVAPVYQARVPVFNFTMCAAPAAASSHTIRVWGRKLREEGDTSEGASNGSEGLLCATLGLGPANLKNRNPTADALWGSGYWDVQTQDATSLAALWCAWVQSAVAVERAETNAPSSRWSAAIKVI